MIQYGTIYLDPPWRYTNTRTGGSLRSGAASQYPTLSEADLCALDIRGRCADAAIVAMWTTQPLLLDGTAHRILAAWGLAPRTMGVWEKTGRLGMGFWLRVQTEYLLVCPLGSARPWRSSERNIYHGPPGRHSEKPAYFRQILERYAPPPRLELFARQHTPGWTCEGWDLDGRDVRASHYDGPVEVQSAVTVAENEETPDVAHR